MTDAAAFGPFASLGGLEIVTKTGMTRRHMDARGRFRFHLACEPLRVDLSFEQAPLMRWAAPGALAPDQGESAVLVYDDAVLGAGNGRAWAGGPHAEAMTSGFKALAAADSRHRIPNRLLWAIGRLSWSLWKIRRPLSSSFLSLRS